MTRLIKCQDCGACLLGGSSLCVSCMHKRLDVVAVPRKRVLVTEAWAVRRGSAWLYVSDQRWGEFANWTDRDSRELWKVRDFAAAQARAFGGKVVRVRTYEVTR